MRLSQVVQHRIHYILITIQGESFCAISSQFLSDGIWLLNVALKDGRNTKDVSRYGELKICFRTGKYYPESMIDFINKDLRAGSSLKGLLNLLGTVAILLHILQ
jgi:hypothetical protein